MKDVLYALRYMPKDKQLKNQAHSLSYAGLKESDRQAGCQSVSQLFSRIYF